MSSLHARGERRGGARPPVDGELALPRRASVVAALPEAHGIHEVSSHRVESEGPHGRTVHAPREVFTRLWCAINGDASWRSNPWVWRIEFKRVEVRDA